MTDRPRWYFFAWFAVLAAAHLAIEGWTDTTAIGLPVGFAATLVLVFVRRLPWWATGGPRPESSGGRRTKVAVFAGLWLLVAAAIVAGLVEHPPHGADLGYAGAFVAMFLGASGYGLTRLLPKRPVTRRAVLRRRLAFATTAVWATGVFVLAAEAAAIVVTGGWLPWVLPVPGLVAVLALAGWRADLALPARHLASGSWTPVAAAAFDVRAGEPVNGWGVLPGGWRIRFHLPAVPADVAAELAGRRRLWLAGWPSEQLVVGLPDGDSYAVGLMGHHRGGGKNTVTDAPGRR
ncbi:hypothetical protein Q5425_20170 [Amycolatopsis sp. A133]|uniref:hypothetical protein n=1 Tax=Amycolatopsis sp. A133 TaxID=3064472 RepID=UPI0027F39E6A|nr:hypothetical protein [Amycolatopsis sp. A133]MDQ7806064.1 hypothetical protein [Amycolatopsis sp. A133]